VEAGTDPALLEALDTARVQLEVEGVALAAVELRPDERAAVRARALLGSEDARGVFWFDQRNPEEIRVFLLDSEGAAHVRRVPIEPASAEASREAVWIIVQSGSMALATGQTLAMEVAQAEEVAGEPEPEPEAIEAEPEAIATPPVEVSVLDEPTPEEDRTQGGLVGAYVGEGVAGAVPWQSGVGIGGVLDLGPRWRLAIDYGLLLPWRAGEPVITWRHRGELRAGPRWAAGERVQLYALLGGGVEGVRWREVSGDGAGWRVVASAGLDTGVEIRLTKWLALLFEPGAGVVLNRFAFVECADGSQACEGAARRVVLEPWRLRPRLRAGLRVGF